MGPNCHASIGLQRVKGIGHKRNEDLLHLAFVHIDWRQRPVEIPDDPQLAQLWVMFYELKRLVDNLVYIARELVGLTLV